MSSSRRAKVVPSALRRRLKRVRRQACLRGDGVGARGAAFQTAGDRFAHVLERMVGGGALPLDLLLAKARDELEQLGIGAGNRQRQRGAGEGKAVGLLVEGDARPEPPLIFGEVRGLAMGETHGHRAPGIAHGALDAPHEAHQHEVGELRHIRHGHRIGPLDAAHARTFHEVEMVGGQHAVIVHEGFERGAEVRRIGHHIAERIGGETAGRPIFEAEAGIARGARGKGKGERKPVERNPGKAVGADVIGKTGLAQDPGPVAAIELERLAQSSEDEGPDTLLADGDVHGITRATVPIVFSIPVPRLPASKNCARAQARLWGEVK